MKKIDLRSDTVTRPTPAMRKVMANAEVGDDVYGDDPTAIALQARAADMLGMEASLFASSGTQTNLLALLSHCERGDEYIVGQHAHTYRYEAGGAAVLGSIQPQPLDFDADGTLNLSKVKDAIKADDPHFAKTRLLCLENTQGGRALPLSYLTEARVFTHQHNLSLHLDGARVFNAAVKCGVPVSEITSQFDSVSVCLSKGLGAPVGSVLGGSREFIIKAHRWRKMLGGAMRQVGIIASAALHVLEHHVERLAEDHDNALALADGLRELNEIGVEYGASQTNMVFVNVPEQHVAPLTAHLQANGIIVSAAKRMRFVTHLDVDRHDVNKVIATMKSYFRE